MTAARRLAAILEQAVDMTALETFTTGLPLAQWRSINKRTGLTGFVLSCMT
jgi:hypothetical protein